MPKSDKEDRDMLLFLPFFASCKCKCKLTLNHRHLSNIDCLTARTACLVCFISTVNGHSMKKGKKAKVWH